MRQPQVWNVILLCSLFVWVGAGGKATSFSAKTGVALGKDAELINTRTEAVSYKGKSALRLLPLAGQEQSDQGMMAILPNKDFQDGTIEADLSGAPRSDAKPNMRGFIGIAFRVQEHGAKSEIFYIRPVNARFDDQLVRNHTLQYVSEPDYGWQRLRKENPGVYESYADMEAGAWVHVKIEVSGSKARLYVNGASQPALIVNDLKLGECRGKIALWSYTATDGYFANLVVR